MSVKRTRLKRTSEKHVVLTGEVWNHLCGLLERLDSFTATPPLYFARDDASGRVLAVKMPEAGTALVRVKVKAVNVGGNSKHMTVVEWNGSTEIGAQFSMRAVMGHAVNDGTTTLVVAQKVRDGTDVATVEWLEQLVIDPAATRYQVVQTIDATGRLGIDSARVEA